MGCIKAEVGKVNCKECELKDDTICGVFKEYELDLLNQFIEKIPVKKGSKLFKEGDKADFAYIISEGAFMKYKVHNDGRRQIMAFTMPGSIVGISPFEEYKYSLQALLDGYVCKIKNSGVEILSEQNMELQKKINEFLSYELDKTQDHMFVLGRSNAVEKISLFLCNIYDYQNEYFGKRVNNDILFIPIRRVDIADYLGLTTESVSRVFADFKKQKIIDIVDRSHTRILNIDKLRAITACYS